MLNSPLVRAIVPSQTAGAKRIRSAPGLVLAAVIAARSEPGPLSARLRTVKGAEDGAVLQPFDTQPRRQRPLRGAVRGRCPFSVPDGAKRERADRSQDDRRIAKTPSKTGLRYNGKTSLPGANRARGGAGPVRGLLGGWASPAAFV